MKLKVSSLIHAVLGVYKIPSNTIPNVIVLLLGAERGGGVTIKHFVTPNFVQSVFGPKQRTFETRGHWLQFYPP